MTPIATIAQYTAEGKCVYIKYNTGDEVWFRFDGDVRLVTKIHTHDGIKLELDQKKPMKFTVTKTYIIEESYEWEVEAASKEEALEMAGDSQPPEDALVGSKIQCSNLEVQS